MRDESSQVQFRMEMCKVGHFYPQMLLENDNVWKPVDCFDCLKEGYDRLKIASQKVLRIESL